MRQEQAMEIQSLIERQWALLREGKYWETQEY
jgi:hypothetical protein